MPGSAMAGRAAARVGHGLRPNPAPQSRDQFVGFAQGRIGMAVTEFCGLPSITRSL